MKISFITTVFNEEKSIDKFLKSLFAQSKLPDEIVIVDGGSTDKTIERIANCELRIKKKRVIFKLIIKRGNRAVGRNEAIRKATGDVIACSDSGNVLDKKWFENIIKPFGFAQGKPFKNVDVVAGYYKGLAKNIFQKCLIPYALVMPDKVNPDTFLPATRSVAFTKAIWKKARGFDERYSHNEDYVFANRLKEMGAKIVFAKDAVVHWIPRDSFKEAFVMFSRFAFGDAEAGIWRPKVLLLFARYLIGSSLLLFSVLHRSFMLIVLVGISLILYLLWSLWKNYRYVKNSQAFLILPLLQLTSDMAVLAGTVLAFLRTFFFKWIAMFFILSLLIFISFRVLRKMFPLPEINQEKIVGYSQYYGYPLYFDTILFFTFLLLPIVTFILCKKIFKK